MTAAPFSRSLFATLALVLGLTTMTGCAATAADNEPTEISDPLEGFNRAIYGVNEAADILLIGPAANIYKDAVPSPLQTAFRNFVQNLKMPLVAVNHLLQGRFETAGLDTGRFLFNTITGFGGTVDTATAYGMPLQETDFGTTLASWGLDTGPYLVLPLFGPSNLRDGVGKAVDWVGDPVRMIAANNDAGTAYLAAGALRGIDARATIDPVIRDIRTNSIDTYATTRSMFSQRRASDIEARLKPDTK